MAGEAQTSQFFLSTGTVMVGASEDVMGLTPAANSVGLTKNIQVQSDPKYTELTQGVDAQVVFSVNTERQVKITADVYEMTAKNIIYAAGQDGTSAVAGANYTLASAVSGGGASVPLATGDGAHFGAGDFVVLNDGGDKVHVGKVASIATDTLTLDAAYAMPVDMTWAVATTKVYKVSAVKLGANADQPTYGVKIVGTMPGTGEPLTMVFPKVKITKGLSFAFNEQNFSSMPFEFTPYALLPSDPFYADLGGKTGLILKAS